MKRISSSVVALLALTLLATDAGAAVSLAFTDNDPTPTSATVAPGRRFTISAKLVETLTSEQISGVDYQIHASTGGVFEFLSRNSQVAGSLFTSPNGDTDAQLIATVLNPDNGTDLGTSTQSGLGVAGPGSFELADISLQVLPNTAPGVYSLSFVDTSYSGPPPAYTTNQYGALTNLGTFSVTVAVPEPASICGLALAGLGLASRWRRL